MDARTNTGMGGGGVPVHWLDGGWQDRATLVANSNSQFYGGEWVNRKWGAYVTGNSAYFHEKYMIWTGCDSKGVAHPEGYMDSDTGMVAVGTPRDRGHAPLGPDDPDFVGVEKGKYRPLYAISPIFTVVDDGSPRTIWSSSITVVTTTDVQGQVIDKFAGFGPGFGGILGSTQFTYEGTAYSVSGVLTQKQTLSGSVTVDLLQLQMASLLPAESDSILVLELDGKRFPLADATRGTKFYSWDDHGLTWADGETVEVKLIELPEGN